MCSTRQEKVTGIRTARETGALGRCGTGMWAKDRCEAGAGRQEGEVRRG